ncbi:hypothetical protein [Candidatus Bathycorpusculum sp.]|uniref:hypothetical protein n=1 Tax=Candidatus Bathycorpusculum sp. TaxID=2994959 RepID=UPI00282EB281|nr:hypothetical protein [Candidatus Termitimicrobium sp.]
MRIQAQLLLIFVCINAAMGLVTALQGLGVIDLFSAISTPEQTLDSAAVQYGDPGEIATAWSTRDPPTLLGVIGDIMGSIPWYFSMMLSLVAGFPMLVLQLSSAFPLDPLASNVVLAFDMALVAIWGFLMVSFVIELISGRPLNEY